MSNSKTKSHSPKRSEGVVKRALDLGTGGGVPINASEHNLAAMGRKDLLAFIGSLQAQNMALHGELSIQHERSNQALRLVGQMYQFMFGINFAYIEALRNFKEAGNNKPLPAMWLAARVCDAYEGYFDAHNITALDIGPDKALLRNLYDIANRKMNPGSKIAEYCGIGMPVADDLAEAIKDELRKRPATPKGKVNGKAKKKK